MMPRLRPPRLLPITILALAGLLAVKSVELVRAATTTADAATQVSTTPQAAAPARLDRLHYRQWQCRAWRQYPGAAPVPRRGATGGVYRHRRPR